MKEKTRRSLTLFVEKAQKLQSFGLLEHIRAKGRGFHIIQINQDGSSTVEFDLPNEKERDASLLTLRLFIQQNESFSFHKLNNIANDPTLSGKFRNKLLQIRHVYFDYLNDYPRTVLPGFFEENTHPCRAEILNVVMNGGLSHTRNYETRQIYQLWSRDDIRESVLLQEFSEIIMNILIIIFASSTSIKTELDGEITSIPTG